MIRLLALCYLSLLLLGLADNLRGPLFPEILKEFSLSDTVGSLFFSLSSLCGFLGGLSSPWWIRRWGPVGSLRLGIFLCVLSQLGFSWAPNFIWLIVSVLFFGFSLGIMGVIQNTLVVSQSPLALRSRLISGLHSMYALASLLAPLAVGWLSKTFPEHNIWRLSFQVGAAFAGLVLVASWGSFPLKEQELSNEKPDQHQSVARQYYFAVILASYVLAEILISSRLALYMRREYQADLITSSYYTAGFFVAILLGRGLFAIWTPRVALMKQLIASLLLAALSMVAGLCLHPAGLMISGFFLAPFYPLMMVEIGRVFHLSLDQTVAKAVALSSLFVVGMHVAVGTLTDWYGIRVAFALGPLFCLISFGMLWFHEKIFRWLQS